MGSPSEPPHAWLGGLTPEEGGVDGPALTGYAAVEDAVEAVLGARVAGAFSGYRGLWGAVLVDGVVRALQGWEGEWAWVMGADALLSCATVCGALGIDVGWVRGRVKAQRGRVVGWQWKLRVRRGSARPSHGKGRAGKRGRG